MKNGQGALGTSLPIQHRHEVDDLRRLAGGIALAQGFDEIQLERTSLVASEMATNLLKYARSGQILVRAVEWDDLRGVELVATDSGPGISDVEGSWIDGFSTGGSLGEGLGAIARLSDLCDLYSSVGHGTVMMARLWSRSPPERADRSFLVGSMAEAIPGEVVSGDAWAVEQHGTRIVALVADGLGHGMYAAEASSAAVDAFRKHHHEPAEDIVRLLHRALHSTRGAAIAVAEIDLATGRIGFCGIGNISARLLDAGQHRELISHHGIAGYQARRIQAFEEAWQQDTLLVMHSDGLSARWDLRAYPGLQSHHPQLAAATVMRDADRAFDDATVLVLRGDPGPAPAVESP